MPRKVISKIKNKEPRTRKSAGLSIPVLSLLGKEVSTLTLPKEIFGVEINKSLISQALHIYQSNQKSHWAHTKTRGEVQGSTRKIWKQKGTGRARHGSITAPIFVGGGIALGPKSRKVELEFPKKMRKAALLSVLSQKLTDQQIVGIGGLEKVTGKTSQMVKFSKALGKKSILIVGSEKQEMVERSVANLKSVEYSTATNLNVLDIVRYNTLVITAEAVAKLAKRVSK